MSKMKDFLGNDEYHKHKDKECKNCICEMLEDIVKAQQEVRSNHRGDNCTNPLSDIHHQPTHDTIPFILQTPYGHPFFTWGNVGTDKCFVTVFFSVVKVDCEENCAVLKLLKPNASLIDPDTDSVEPALICNVDYVTKTDECVLVDLKCFSALKCLKPSFVKKR